MFLSLIPIDTDSGPKKEICGEKLNVRAHVLHNTADDSYAQKLIV